MHVDDHIAARQQHAIQMLHPRLSQHALDDRLDHLRQTLIEFVAIHVISRSQVGETSIARLSSDQRGRQYSVESIACSVAFEPIQVLPQCTGYNHDGRRRAMSRGATQLSTAAIEGISRMEALMIGVSGMRGTIGGTLTPAVVTPHGRARLPPG